MEPGSGPPASAEAARPAALAKPPSPRPPIVYNPHRIHSWRSAMPKIEKFCANGVFDPPTYSQGIKVSDAHTVLFLAGQVAYDKDGAVAHRGDVKSQAREASS